MPSLLDLFCKYANSAGLADHSYIVGGSVRDLLLNKDLKDIDIAVNADALAAGRAFADEIKASFVLLDENFGIARIAFFGEYLDICHINNGSITENLGERDLTINAMAMPLTAFVSLPPMAENEQLKPLIIDPFDGIGDIEKGIIRMVSKENLAADPLRLLRVYRFAVTLGFDISPDTTAAVKALSGLISQSASERIAEELRQILRNHASASTLKNMRDSGLIAALFPYSAVGSDDAWHDIQSAYDNVEDILNNLAARFGNRSGLLQEYFRKEYRTDCLKLSVLFKDIDSAERVAGRLKLSRKEIVFIRTIVAYNKIISSLGGAKKAVIMGLFRELGDNIYAVLIYILAVSGPLTSQDMNMQLANELISIYQDEYLPRLKRLPLITGNDLIVDFGLSPSIFFKDILSAIELLALEGMVTSREEALKAAGDMIHNKHLA
jgi:tRNA nucleotidyltransferase (CCA-adding enzyme)